MERSHPHPDPLPSREREGDAVAPPDTTRSFFDRRPPRWVLLALICAALAIRGRAMLAMQDSLARDPDHYSEIGWYVHYQHTFASNGEFPTALRPPLYPLLLSLSYYLLDDFGRVEAVHPVYGIFHVALGVATACIVWRLGLAWGLPPLASLLAATLVTVDPILVNQQAQVMTETLAAFLAALAMLTLPRDTSDNLVWRAALAGGLLGLCVLCRPTFAAWLVTVVVVWPIAVSGSRKILRCAALIGAAAIVLAPWVIRNQIAFGYPIVTTTHGGQTLLLGNNPSFYAWLRAGEWGSVWDGDANGTVGNRPNLPNTRLLTDNSQTDRDRAAYETAYQNIAAEPGMFAYACLVRVARLWGVLPHQLSADESPTRRGLRYAVAVFYTFELLLAAIGAWMFGKQLWKTPVLWGTLLVLAFTAVHTVYWTDLRMRAPLTCVVAILAAAAVAQLASKEPAAIHSAPMA